MLEALLDQMYSSIKFSNDIKAPGNNGSKIPFTLKSSRIWDSIFSKLMISSYNREKVFNLCWVGSTYHKSKQRKNLSYKKLPP